MWYRPNGYGPRQKVKLLQKYESNEWRVRAVDTGFYYLAFPKELFTIY